jgi:hypothetical protein
VQSRSVRPGCRGSSHCTACPATGRGASRRAVGVSIRCATTLGALRTSRPRDREANGQTRPIGDHHGLRRERLGSAGAPARGGLCRPRGPRTAMQREKESSGTLAPAAALYESRRWRPVRPQPVTRRARGSEAVRFRRENAWLCETSARVAPIPPANANAGNRDGGPVRQGRPQTVAPKPRRDVGKPRGVRTPNQRRRVFGPRRPPLRSARRRGERFALTPARTRAMPRRALRVEGSRR